MFALARSLWRPVRPFARRLAAAAVMVAGFSSGTVALAAEEGPSWSQLSSLERQALDPLQQQWPEIDGVRKQKWRELAQRYPSLPIEQQTRIRNRMVEWARMSAVERNAARLRYQAAKGLTPSERQAKWNQYQALSSEERQALLGKAEERRNQPAVGARPAATLVEVQRKSNIVPAAPSVQRSKPVGPGTVQAAVGASTRPINQRPIPPNHQTPGQPKIAATPEFVDRTTLLPQRGPQAALVEPRRASQ